MCGVAAVFSKRRKEAYPAGVMVRMLELLRHRGEDATGLAVYVPVRPGLFRLRVSCRHPERDLPAIQAAVAAYGQWVASEVQPTHAPYFMVDARLELAPDKAGELYCRLEQHDDLCVHSLSDTMVVFKDVGGAGNVASYPGLEIIRGTHLVGHVRLATESIENLNFAHPFSSALCPDLCVVHNGQLTNYFNLRRRLQAKGVSFKTFNDSELIAHYLAYRMQEEGLSFREALAASVDDLDGVFSYLAATGRELGAVQDRLGLKPIVIYETEDEVLLGSERLCFSVLDENAGGEEITPGEVRVWCNWT